VVTTAAARVSAMTWQIAVELSSTHCHQALPQTRAEVSSEPTTGLARTAAAIGAAAASNGICARPRMLAIAPSLIVRPNTSPITRARRWKLIA
jgi:hypothetical protein